MGRTSRHLLGYRIPMLDGDTLGKDTCGHQTWLLGEKSQNNKYARDEFGLSEVLHYLAPYTRTCWSEVRLQGTTYVSVLKKENCYFEQKPGQSFIFKKKYSKHSGRAYSKELQRTSKLHSMSAKPLLFPFHIRFWVVVSSIVAALSKVSPILTAFQS